MHEGQLSVAVGTVRELIDIQFPQYARAPITEVSAAGTVNAIFRVGEEAAARFPIQAGDVAETRTWLMDEAAAAGELLGRTRFPTPAPLGVGEPGAGYPLPWSLQTWVPGIPAAQDDPGDSMLFALDLAEFIAGVRAISTGGRVFSGGGRGGDLPSHDEWVQTCLDRSCHLLDVPAMRILWAGMRELPRGTTQDVMSHGDLMPGNVLVADGRLAGVIDVGGLGPADPALDLVSAWHLLEAPGRRVLRAELGCDDLEWARGRAWAFEQAVGLVWYYDRSNPAMSAQGRRTLQRLITDAAP